MTTDTAVGVPYISFQSLLNQVERMEDAPLPPQIDRSFLGTMSGGYQSQFISALKDMGFIADDLSVQPAFVAFVEGTPETRKSIVRDVLHRLYPSALAVAQANGTMRQLDDAFDQYGFSGSTKRKAIAFFLKAAEFADLELSPHFKTPRTRAVRSRKPNGGKRASPRSIEDPLTPNVQRSEGDLKGKYVALLLQRIEQSEELDQELLDRIERLLGFRDSKDA